MSDIIIIVALTARIGLLGLERIILQIFGRSTDDDQSIAVTAIFFGIGAGILLIIGFPSFIFVPEAIINAFFASLFYSAAFVFYSSSLRSSPVSLVAPLYNFNILFLLILSVFFLGSQFTWFNIFGILLMFFGLSYLERSTTVIESIKSVFNYMGARFMIFASLLMAIGRTIDAFTIGVTNIDSFSYSFYIYTLITLDLLIVLLITQKLSECVTVIKQAPVAAFVSGTVNSLSYLALVVAIARGMDVAIAEPLSTLSIFIALILAVVFLHEEINQRWIAAIFLVVGAVFLLL